MTLERLTAGRLELPVVDTGSGPLLAEEGPARPLARLLNVVATDAVPPGFRARLDAGDDAEAPGLFALRATPARATDADRRGWAALAGEDPHEDAYLLGTRDVPGRLLVPRGVLLALLSRLEALRRAAPPGPGAALARMLEADAAAVDDLELAGTPDAVARAAVKRAVLLELLEEAGLLAPELSAAWRAILDREGLWRLLGYADAAAARHRYVCSPQRAQVLGDAGADGPAMVSLDWFRLRSPTPDGENPFAWLAGWERTLRGEPGPDAAAGFVLVREGGAWWRMEWRRDDGETPAVLAVGPVGD